MDSSTSQPKRLMEQQGLRRLQRHQATQPVLLHLIQLLREELLCCSHELAMSPLTPTEQQSPKQHQPAPRLPLQRKLLQQDALKPNIITNRICDQLTNVCDANDAAKTACMVAKAQISALGTKDATSAVAWNTALGLAGTNTDPDNAPQAGLINHA